MHSHFSVVLLLRAASFARNFIHYGKNSNTGCKVMKSKISVPLFRYFTYITKCKDPKACTILLRGASKDVLNEVERNLQDTMQVTRNILVDPRMVPGGGAIEVAVAHVSQIGNLLAFC